MTEETQGEHDLLALLRSLPMLVTLKEADGRLAYMSPMALELLGAPKLPLDPSVIQLFSPESALELFEGDRRAMQGELVQIPIWLNSAAGARKHFAMMKFPVEGPRGRMVGTIGVNITPFSSNAWETSMYRQILDAISDLVLVKGPKSRLLWANKAFQTAYGMTNAELQGIIEAPFVEPDLLDKYVRDDMKVFATGERLDIADEPMKWHDGRTRSVHTVKSPIFGEDGTVKMMVAVIRDITDRKALEAELHQSQKLESLGMLAAGMAHEINTPIQFIGDQRSFAEGAFHDLLGLVSKYQALAKKVAAGTATPADAEEVQAEETAIDLAYLQEGLATSFTDMADGVGRVARLVQALKEFGHPDEGVSELVDVNAAIRRTVVVCTNEYRYHAELSLDLGEIPPTRGNTSELQQVLLNLVVNAAHAIADLEHSTRGKIEIATRTDDTHVSITVRDTGCGIPEAVQSRVFDPFFTTKSVGRGTGQGLSIARMLVEKHAGTIAFDTSPGQGTTFTVKFPR